MNQNMHKEITINAFVIRIIRPFLKTSMIVSLSFVLLFSYMISRPNTVQTSMGKVGPGDNSPSEVDYIEAVKKPIGTIPIEFIAACLLFYLYIFKNAGDQLFGGNEIVNALEGVIEF
jgi:hypothetical protein